MLISQLKHELEELANFIGKRMASWNESASTPDEVRSELKSKNAIPAHRKRFRTTP
jgi:hypothetical protein